MKSISILIIQLYFLAIGRSFAQEKLQLTIEYYDHKLTYSLPINDSFTPKTIREHNGELNETYNEAHFRDSSVIYITDNLKSGGGRENYKILKYGEHYGLNYFILMDTSTLYGSYKNKYWRERKYYNIVVGYYDVPEEKKAAYDKILDAIVPQVEKFRSKYHFNESQNLQHEASHIKN